MLPVVMALVALVAIYAALMIVRRRPRPAAPADEGPDAPAPRRALGLMPVVTAGLLTGAGLLVIDRARAEAGGAGMPALVGGGALIALGLGLLMVATAAARRR